MDLPVSVLIHGAVSGPTICLPAHGAAPGRSVHVLPGAAVAGLGARVGARARAPRLLAGGRAHGLERARARARAPPRLLAGRRAHSTARARARAPSLLSPTRPPPLTAPRSPSPWPRPPPRTKTALSLSRPPAGTRGGAMPGAGMRWRRATCSCIPAMAVQWGGAAGFSAVRAARATVGASAMASAPAAVAPGSHHCGRCSGEHCHSLGQLLLFTVASRCCPRLSGRRRGPRLRFLAGGAPMRWPRSGSSPLTFMPHLCRQSV